MKMNRAHKEAVVRNKINGDFYVIENNHKNAGKIISAEAVQVDEKATLEALEVNYDYDTADKARFLMENLPFLGAHELKRIPDSKITITEENAICFRVIKESYENLEKEDWSIQNGILMRNGYQAAEQGEMEIEKILAVFPEKVLLAVKADVEGYVSLKFFNPNYGGKEFYEAMGDTMPIPEKVELPADRGILFYYSRTHTEESGEGEKKTTKEVVDASEYIIYDQTGNFLGYNKYDTSSEHHESDGPLGSYVTATERYILFQGIFNGNPFTNVLNIVDSELESIELKSNIVSATEDIDHRLLVKTYDELAVVSLKNPPFVLKATKQLRNALKDLRGYDYIADFSNEDKHFCLTLATKECKVKKLKGSRTRDLGLVLTVE